MTASKISQCAVCPPAYLDSLGSGIQAPPAQTAAIIIHLLNTSRKLGCNKTTSALHFTHTDKLPCASSRRCQPERFHISAAVCNLHFLSAASFAEEKICPPATPQNTQPDLTSVFVCVRASSKLPKARVKLEYVHFVSIWPLRRHCIFFIHTHTHTHDPWSPPNCRCIFHFAVPPLPPPPPDNCQRCSDPPRRLR